MKVDGAIGFHSDASVIAQSAKYQEELGFDGIWVPETGHDPFVVLALASQLVSKIELGTGIAVAFARNPMNMAMLANDLQILSKGRFMLGLGSQIKPHIEKRYSMPWSSPAKRMREFIQAMRAIWHSWNTGEKLEFRGEFYTHTLMTPFFSPGSNQYGAPKVFLAAVGELMAQVAGEVADGILIHGFTTERYLKEVTIPAVQKGLAKAGKNRADFEVSYPAFVVSGNNEGEIQAAESLVKQQIAFYGSTPAYRPVLELHGWGDLQTELNTLSKQGKWVEMGSLISDDILNAFAVVDEMSNVAKRLKERFSGVVDRISFYTVGSMSSEGWQAVISELKKA
jgi:probable F420-dependent oxidoreductase